MRIAILHPGAMGAAIGAQLVRAGHVVVWLPEGRGSGTRRRAAAAGLVSADSIDGCEAVLSVVPPSAAEQTAGSVARFTGLYVDLNAIDPVTAARILQTVQQGGARAADGGVIGPPPVGPGTTRVVLSGEHAQEAAALLRDTDAEPVVLDAGPTAASALKMAYGAWTKGSAALLLAVQATAEHYGVAAALDDEWRRSQPDLPRRLRSAEESADAKGWRWVAEMRAEAATFAAAGQPVGFAEAAAEVYGRRSRPIDD